MAHVLVVGMTASGKTTLAKRLTKRLRDLGFAVLVIDPIADPDWPTPHRYTDPAAFLHAAKGARRCVLVIDEAGDVIGHYQREMLWAATRSRHLGHKAFFITQRAAQLSPTVRGQCTELYVFRVSEDDARDLAREWSEPALLDAPRLAQGECLALERFGKCERIAVFRSIPASRAVSA